MPLTPIGEIIKNAAPNVRTIENGSSEIKACNGYNFCNNITSTQALFQGQFVTVHMKNQTERNSYEY